MSIGNMEGVKTAASDKLRKVDFKMVSFTLGGKDYGVDIMKVKEIRKAGNFTHVPNTPVFVRGVDNLRGDIIPIIDLRVMFNLSVEAKGPQELENIIILRLDELILGIIVDSIEKVVGINSETIQPPHPIFGDINVKYISGVVEHENRLYIILDVMRIFQAKDEAEKPAEKSAPAQTLPAAKASAPAKTPAAPAKAKSAPQAPMGSEDEEDKPAPAPAARTKAAPAAEPDPVESLFLKDTLSTFAGFSVSPLNRDWVTQRARQWQKERDQAGQSPQLASREEAADFLRGFASPYTGTLWPLDSAQEFAASLELQGQNFMVWNPGCGQGAESYSLAAGFSRAYPGKSFKIWANDNDLLNISMAPSLVFPEDQVPEGYEDFLIKARGGMQFHIDLKNRILFEYHDINHLNPFTDLHVIVARDLLSFLKPEEQTKVLEDFAEKLRPKGVLLLGRNEKLNSSVDWVPLGGTAWSAYQKASH